MVKKHQNNPVIIDESLLANLATKQDIAVLATKQELYTVKHELQMDIRSLEVRMEKGFADNLRWIVMAMIAICSVFTACIKLL